MSPQLIFGTATFGMDSTKFQDIESVERLLSCLQDLGINRLDSGARYPPLKPGRAEELIGEADHFSRDFSIDTKIYTNTATDGSGDLTREACDKSLNGSLQRLKRHDGINILYAHRPDSSTPLEEQISSFKHHIEQGHCKAWGVSNFPPDLLEKVLQVCQEQGFRKPSCYQGDYNVVTRGMETKLLPILRSHGMVFNAFRPLAGGFLTGKLINNEHAGTRFGDENPLGRFAQKLFGAEDLHSAMKKFDIGVKSQNLTPNEVAIRWITHHSALGGTDAVILGASKTEQIRETVQMIKKGPLSDEVLKLTEELWGAVKRSRGDVI